MAIAPTRTDAELVRRLQARDRTAWEELYAEYQPRLRAFGYRLAGNAHDADDLVQETFVRALPALDRLDPDRVDLTAYLFTTTKNLFLKQVERAKRAEPTADVPEPDLPTAIEDDPERSALLRRQQHEVRVANARLDPRQRLVLALCELEDRSYAEIGELVDLNENAVAQLVFRARERLRTELRLAQVDPERLPEECRSFLPLLAQHLDGRLKGEKLETTLAHVEGCERCQAALADMREAKRRYRALLLPPLGVPVEDARAAVEADLDRAGYWRGAAGRRPLLRRRGAAPLAAAAVAVLCVGGGLAAATLLVDETAAPTALPAVSESDASTPSSKPPAPTTTAAVTTATATTTTAAAGPAPTTAPAETTAAALPAPTTTAEPATSTPKAKAKTKPKPAPTTTEPAQEPAPAPPATTTPKVAPPPAPKDKQAPTVTITSAPAETTPATSATLAFSASEPQVVFSCRLDTGPWQACTSPHTVEGLAVGAHTFVARAADRAGNVGTPAAHGWTVTPPPDTTAPTVTLTQGPPATTTSRSATFVFTASEANVTFACSYDAGPFASCTSPYMIGDAGIDDHTLAVRATDAAGNTGSPVLARWTVVEPLPDLVAVLADGRVTVRNVGEGSAGPSLVTVVGIATFSIPRLGPGQSITRAFACQRGSRTAVADYAKAVAESNEANNTASNVASCLGG